ncbi:inositol monophosphatase family protein [Pirellulales bacterium]|nr:inositol monophosphatase family protein [Pirellulales bacterium]
MLSNSILLDACRDAAQAGAAELLAWQDHFEAREKAPCDMVTDADLASEKAVIEVIRSQFPDHAIVGEESAGSKATIRQLLGDEYCWVIDPLDGTANYVHGYPCYAVSVAVACRGELAAGVVWDPVANEVFAASAGGGATLNGKQIGVSETKAPRKALVAVSFPPGVTADSTDMRAFLRIAPVVQAVRRTGSAALNLAYVACGRLDAHWAHHIHPWDSAAGILLIREAGGVATDAGGKAFDLANGNYFVAGTRELHAELLALTTNVPREGLPLAPGK